MYRNTHSHFANGGCIGVKGKSALRRYMHLFIAAYGARIIYGIQRQLQDRVSG